MSEDTCYLCDWTEEAPDECYVCHFPAEELRLYPHATRHDNEDALPENKHLWLCGLCAGTQAAKTYQYPRWCPGQGAILETICYVGNEILEALKATEEPTDDR